MENKSSFRIFTLTILAIGLITSIGTTFFCSCNNPKKHKANNDISIDSNVIISKSYGVYNYNEKKILFEDNEIECTFSQVIDGSSCASNIYLNFIPKSNITSKIIHIAGKMKWQQDQKSIACPFILCHIGTSIFNNTTQVEDDSFISDSLITDKFKNIAGQNNSLLYNIEFCDTAYKPIPINVDKVIIELEIDINSKGETKHYRKTVDLDEVIHKNQIPLGRND